MTWLGAYKQRGKVAGGVHAAGSEVQHAGGQGQAVHAAGADAVAFQEVAAQLQEAHAPVLAAVVVKLGLRGHAVQDGLLDASHAGLHFIAHGLNLAALGVSVTTAGGIAAGQLIEHRAAGLLHRVTRANQASGQVGYTVAGAEVGDVSGGRGGGNRCLAHGLGRGIALAALGGGAGLRGGAMRCRRGRRRSGGRGGAAAGISALRHGGILSGLGFGGEAHRGQEMGAGLDELAGEGAQLESLVCRSCAIGARG